MGFVEEDNSGKANIFAVEPKTLWTASPRADKEARRGLGGTQGLAVVLGVAGAVAVATVGTCRLVCCRFLLLLSEWSCIVRETLTRAEAISSGVSFFQGDSLEEVGRGYGGGETLQEIAARM